MSEYEPIELQFDLATQDAKAAGRKPEGDPPTSMAEVAQNVGSGGEVPTFGALAEVPEVPGKVDQEPEITPPQTGWRGDPIKVEMVSDTPEQTVFKIERADE